MPVDAVEVERCGTGRGEHHRVLRVDGDSGPGVGAADQLVRIRRPRVVRELAGLRDRVENPAQLAGVHVVRADVAGRAGQRLGDARAHDEHVLEDRSRCARAALGCHAEAFAQVNASRSPERRDRLAGLLIQRVEPVAIRDEHAILVHGHAAVSESRGRRRAAAWIELPDLASRGRVHGDHLERRRRRVEHAVDDDRVALHLRGLERIVRVVRPRGLQLRDVVAVDLRERGIADVVDAAVDGPWDIVRRERCDRKDRDGTTDFHNRVTCAATATHPAARLSQMSVYRPRPSWPASVVKCVSA